LHRRFRAALCLGRSETTRLAPDELANKILIYGKGN
jgi:hypothetical protein